MGWGARACGEVGRERRHVAQALHGRVEVARVPEVHKALEPVSGVRVRLSIRFGVRVRAGLRLVSGGGGLEPTFIDPVYLAWPDLLMPSTCQIGAGQGFGPRLRVRHRTKAQAPNPNPNPNPNPELLIG